MAITRISQSSVKEGLEKYNSFYGGASGMLFGQFESIATVTVGSGGASSIEFTSIPGTYQHLQIRGIVRSNRSDVFDNASFRFNGDAAANYDNHALWGDGATAQSARRGQNQIESAYTSGATSPASTFAAFVLDILDYASTSKNKVARSAIGTDQNGAGAAAINSGLWISTSAITSIAITPLLSTLWSQHSTAALYGVRA